MFILVLVVSQVSRLSKSHRRRENRHHKHIPSREKKKVFLFVNQVASLGTSNTGFTSSKAPKKLKSQWDGNCSKELYFQLQIFIYVRRFGMALVSRLLARRILGNVCSRRSLDRLSTSLKSLFLLRHVARVYTNGATSIANASSRFWLFSGFLVSMLVEVFRVAGARTMPPVILSLLSLWARFNVINKWLRRWKIIPFSCSLHDDISEVLVLLTLSTHSSWSPQTLFFNDQCQCWSRWLITNKTIFTIYVYSSVVFIRKACFSNCDNLWRLFVSALCTQLQYVWNSRVGFIYAPFFNRRDYANCFLILFICNYSHTTSFFSTHKRRLIEYLSHISLAAPMIYLRSWNSER